MGCLSLSYTFYGRLPKRCLVHKTHTMQKNRRCFFFPGSWTDHQKTEVLLQIAYTFQNAPRQFLPPILLIATVQARLRFSELP